MRTPRVCSNEKRRRWRAAALAAIVYGGFVTSSAVGQSPKESDVEAAYLFNFAKFMYERAHSPDSFTIGVVGKSPIGPMLDAITTNEQIDGRPLKIVHPATADQARNCDIVFLSESEAPRMEKDIAALAGSNTLTVSNLPDFAQRGGMIQFRIVDSRVRFLVNLDAVTKEKITLSSELLKVAMSVSGAASSEAKP